MRNTSERLPIKERVVVVNKFTQRVANSGYSRDQARRFIIAGLRCYDAAKRIA